MPSRWFFGCVVAIVSGCGGGGSDQTPLIDTAPVATGSSNNGNSGSSGEASSDSDGGEAGTSATGACASGSTAQGCPCTTSGQTVACGQVHRVSGDYVSCSPGTQTCDTDLTWGACLGDRVGAP